jgi:trimethylguanosine synthase
MGKRKGGGLTGVSRFVLESFKNDPASQPILPEPVVQDSQHPGDGAPHEYEQHVENRPSKRRKTKPSNTVPDSQTQNKETGQWIEKYDATGLVPHYTETSQVPDHLQKCASSHRSHLIF